jgi:type VII secretion-associated serine protease mycosin
MRSIGRLKALVLTILVVAGSSVGIPSSADASPVSAGAPRTVSLPADQSRDGQWWFTSWQIGKAWEVGAQGQGVTVAVLDTGVQATRSELSGVVLPGNDFHGGDAHTDIDTVKHGHGTQMAILIAGQGGTTGLTGIAPQAKILPVRSGSEKSNYADAIRWAADNGARVINMSFGTPTSCDLDQATADAVQYAVNKGAVLVAAAGNDKLNGNPSPTPASCPGVLTVGAVDADMNSWEKSNTGPFVDVAAPGVHIVSVDNQGQEGITGGTSDASALVSGAVALVWSKYPNLTNRQVVARILATTRDIGPDGRDDASGYGIVRPWNAIATNVPADAPNPVYDALGGTIASDTPTPTPTPSKPDQSSDAAPASSNGSGPNAALIVGTVTGIGVLLLVIAIVVIAATRRRAPHPGSPTRTPGPPPPLGPYPPHTPATGPPPPGYPPSGYPPYAGPQAPPPPSPPGTGYPPNGPRPPTTNSW